MSCRGLVRKSSTSVGCLCIIVCIIYLSIYAFMFLSFPPPPETTFSTSPPSSSSSFPCTSKQFVNTMERLHRKVSMNNHVADHNLDHNHTILLGLEPGLHTILSISLFSVMRSWLEEGVWARGDEEPSSSGPLSETQFFVYGKQCKHYAGLPNTKKHSCAFAPKLLYKLSNKAS